ncbi:hypothetical protein FN846DRAFT_888473 [Sphaerosporella brunnea]|uniref:Uncharacterized protein n=1 Tax=Sphaerosporella brunnea TaxID=1250544 RepID=A0A5J5F2V8_9PEZI|nr:hypothetical protein FN846DRAFT_888473 [Sphaerosporella brunnea]
MPRMSDFPTFDGQGSSLLEWTSQIQLLLPAYFPFYDKLGKPGLLLLVNFCIGLFTGNAAERAATETFRIPDTAATSEEVLAPLIGMIKGAFKDPTVVKSARDKLREFTGHGFTFVRFRLEFETLCRKAEVQIHHKTSTSMVAECFRTALSPSNLRTVRSTPVLGIDDCCDPMDLTLEEMYRILEPRWYVQYPKQDAPGRSAKPATVAVRAAPIEKTAAGATVPTDVPKDCRGPLSEGGDADQSQALKDRLKDTRRCWFCRQTGCAGSPANGNVPDNLCRDAMGLCPRFKRFAARGGAVEE